MLAHTIHTVLTLCIRMKHLKLNIILISNVTTNPVHWFYFGDTFGVHIKWRGNAKNTVSTKHNINNNSGRTVINFTLNHNMFTFTEILKTHSTQSAP